MAGIVEKWDVDGVNGKGKHMLCRQGLLLVSTIFQHRLIHRNTLRRRDERNEQKRVFVYIAVY